MIFYFSDDFQTFYSQKNPLSSQNFQAKPDHTEEEVNKSSALSASGENTSDTKAQSTGTSEDLKGVIKQSHGGDISDEEGNVDQDERNQSMDIYKQRQQKKLIKQA